MALEPSTRQRLMWAAGTVMFLAGAMLIGLKIELPYYYSDGSPQMAGSDLERAGKLHWNRPDAEVELPGQLTGRVAQMADGRLLYGVVTEAGTSDLVTWHPKHPDVPPEPADGLNTEHNELAPAVAGDGRIYFASDRPDSIGGYDLFVTTWTARGFGRVEAVLPCNTALDETDPAPDPLGASLVFVRIDRAIDNGHDGVLWSWRIGDPLDPVQVFPEQNQRRERVIDRDPVFAVDGASLWFVRKATGTPLMVCRSSRLGDRFGAPALLSKDWSGAPLRSPLPMPDGRTVGMVQPQTNELAALWYVSRAEVLLPWWPGKPWVEWLLLSLVLCSLLFLLLLYFGQRWSALDLAAQCILLSLLLHVLLFLWFMGVEIAESQLPGSDDDGSDSAMQVSIVSSTAFASAAAAGDSGDVAAKVQRSVREHSFEVAEPGTSISGSELDHRTTLTVDNGSYEAEPIQNAEQSATEQQLDDAAAAMAVRNGADAAAGVTQAQLSAVEQSRQATDAAAVRSQAPSAEFAPQIVRVTTPGSGMQRAAGRAVELAAGDAESARPMHTAAATMLRPTAPTLLDAATAETPARASERAAAAAALVGIGAQATLASATATATLAEPPRGKAIAKNAYSNRIGPAKAKALERFGGTTETERAVRDGLRYLANIQNSSGSWGNQKDYDDKYGFVYIGKTALCVLAFLGAGHTPMSGTEHSAVVRRAISHLVRVQDEDTGAFGASSCYGHGIATYAIAECYGLTKTKPYGDQLVAPLKDALTWILANQGPRRDLRNRGGWGYFSPGLQADDSYARVSVSSWMILALESARMSGVELPEDVLPAAKQYLELSFDRPNGWFRYNHKPARLRSGWPTLPASTPAGGFCLMLLGAKPDNQMVTAAVDYTVDRRPERYRRYRDEDFVLRGQGNVYFWYYGTLCCFLKGGEAWDRWNARLSKVLPAAQSKDGSFPPIGAFAEEAGDTRRNRSYTTAMCVLSLEVYYRYVTPLLLGR